MDAFSHALMGFIVGQALQLDTRLQLILIISSVSLDIDALSIRSREAAFRTHRGPLHSILAAIVTSLLISTGYTIFMRLPITIVVSVVATCLAGLLSHLLLDVLTIGSMTALWPFSKKNFALNLTHFIDPTFLGALLLAALIIIYTKTDVSAIQLVAGIAIAFLALSFGARYYEKNAATKLVKGLDSNVASEIVSFPTIRPDRWWTIKKTPFENGYRYEIYRIDSIRNKILGKDSLESPYVDYSDPVQLPIDSPQKAVACSRRDKRISNFIQKFILPAVDVTSSNDGETWQVLWYDAFTHMSRGRRRGILANVRTDGTTIVDARWTHTTQPQSNLSLKNS